ncbi:MAG TPA: hypothetical protein VL051_09525 [Burkholderiaceae bacterium]|nr:hypothetical protein [Burkholderiaceae bacterium]
MALKLSNNAISRLAGNISNSATTLSLAPGDGALFPSLQAGDWFPATLLKNSGDFEIVRVTDRQVDILTIERAQENTVALAFGAGDRIELRLTAATIAGEFSRIEALAQGAVTTAAAALPKAGGSMAGPLNEKAVTANSTAAYAIDCAAANNFNLTLTANCTFTLVNVPANVACGINLRLKQDASGSRTASWPASVRWASGDVPVLTTAAGKVDYISLLTMDGGATWDGFVGGRNY